MDGVQTAMRCLYEVLGVERDVDDASLRKAYRLLALKWHPDKNQDNLAAAEDRFKEIQNAYEILSDPHERAWYDSHRESILRSGDRYQAGGGGYEAGQRPADEEDLYQYFTAAAYFGFGDGPRGFYGVYDSLFQRLAEAEAKAHEERSRSDRKGKAAPGPFPRFGFSDAPWGEVSAFYAAWAGFGTVKDFAWADQYHTTSAPNRKVRRAMEAENDKSRRTAKREYNEAVRELVAFLRKRDKRVIAHQVEEAKRREERQAQEAARREAERQDRLARAAAYQEAAWVRGEEGSQDSQGETEEDLPEEEQLLHYCLACEKHFKSAAALQNHERSKKHLQQVELLRSVLQEQEEELLGMEGGQEAAQALGTAAGGDGPAAQRSRWGGAGHAPQEAAESGGGSGSEASSAGRAVHGGVPPGSSGYSSSLSSFVASSGNGSRQQQAPATPAHKAPGRHAPPQQQRQQQQRRHEASDTASRGRKEQSASDVSVSDEDDSGSDLDEDAMLDRLVAAAQQPSGGAASSESDEDGDGTDSSNISDSDGRSSSSSSSEQTSQRDSSRESSGESSGDEEEDEAAMLQRLMASQRGPSSRHRPQHGSAAGASHSEAAEQGMSAGEPQDGAAAASEDDLDWGLKPGKQRGKGGKKQAQPQPQQQQGNHHPDISGQNAAPQQQCGKLTAKEKRRQRQAAAAQRAGEPDTLRCGVCQADFPTRNQLFKHLKTEHY